MKILLKFPSRSRPLKFFKTVRNVEENLVSDNYEFSFNIDNNDRLMNTPEALKGLSEIKQSKTEWGHSKSKISACNRNIPEDWDILVLLSDDMRIIAKGFDDLIRKDFEEAGSLDRVIYYSDGFTKDIVSFPVIGRIWYDRFKYIYQPEYLSLFCDEELYIVANREGKLFKSKHKIVSHDHPSNIGGEKDAQLRYTESLHRVDKRTFEKRKRLNFPA